MFEIVDKKKLNDTVSQMKILAPAVAQKALAGQFTVLRVNNHGERIPLTIADIDRKSGTVTLIYQVIGKTTMLLDQLEVGDSVLDFVGPLGVPTPIFSSAKRVCVIGGGVGCAIAYPQALAYHNAKVPCDVIAGFRNADLVILKKETSAIADNYYLVSDDGSTGEKGFVTGKLLQLLQDNVKYDAVFAVGPVVMMRAVCNLTRQYDIKTIVSLNPIMVDGIGMCGGCRVNVGGEVKFACVDGPDFDGHLVDFDNLISRNSMYNENHKCKLSGETHK